MNHPPTESSDDPSEDRQVPNSVPVGGIDRFPPQVIRQNISEISLLLASPEDLPVRDLSAIALLCNRIYDVRVLVISDGTLSHPNSQKYPAPALQSLREQETLTALSILGVERAAVTFLRLKDGSVPTLTAFNFPRAKTLCQAYLKTALPDTIFIPWRFDPHADHRATWQLIQAAILSLGITPQVIEYPIWDWDIQQQQKTPDLVQISGWRLNIEPVLDRKCQAIAAYRSQLGQLIDDDPNGFCLSAELLTNFPRPWEVYFEEVL